MDDWGVAPWIGNLRWRLQTALRQRTVQAREGVENVQCESDLREKLVLEAKCGGKPYVYPYLMREKPYEKIDGFIVSCRSSLQQIQ